MLLGQQQAEESTWWFVDGRKTSSLPIFLTDLDCDWIEWCKEEISSPRKS